MPITHLEADFCGLEDGKVGNVRVWVFWPATFVPVFMGRVVASIYTLGSGSKLIHPLLAPNSANHCGFISQGAYDFCELIF